MHWDVCFISWSSKVESPVVLRDLNVRLQRERRDLLTTINNAARIGAKVARKRLSPHATKPNSSPISTLGNPACGRAVFGSRRRIAGHAPT
jgi:hypothetical protein